MKPGEGSTVVGKSATFRGDLSSTEDLQIDGVVEGTVRLSAGRLTVGVDARVRASISAPEVVVFGRVEGNIHASGRAELRSTAVVMGDVFATRFSIEESAALRGYVDPARASEPIAAVPVAVPVKAVAPTAAVPVAMTAVPVAAVPVAAVPVAGAPVAGAPMIRPVAAPPKSVLGVPRTPDLFNTQTGSPLRTSRQMPSALAAIAAAGLQDPSAEAEAASGTDAVDEDDSTASA